MAASTSGHSMRLLFLSWLIAWATACSAPAGAPTPKDPMTTNSLAIELSVIGDGTDALAVRCVARNVTGHTLHVFDSARMPYVLDEGGALIVLHGVSPPPDDRDLNVIEIPVTRPLEPNQALTFEVALVPLRLRGHYGDESPRPPRHGAASVVCRVGSGDTPIVPGTTSIQGLLGWQRLASSSAVTVRFP
jgi:hypothetical protein